MTQDMSRDSTPWWRDAVVYQIYIRSFADSDGDGVGDLPGIRARLPYLRDLGVDALWITPFYPSPMADGGYDVRDYRNIEPIFGTLADADALLKEAHALDLKVIIDLVPNHTSNEHAWFKAALVSPPGSSERARYIFRRGGADGAPPNDWVSTFGGRAWEPLPDGDWYLHLFAPEQPDLDWLNPGVRDEFESILRFWLDRGVDGFRIDVAHGLAKDPALPDLGEEADSPLEPTKRIDHPHWDRDELHDVYRGWRRVLDQSGGELMLVAEAWVATPQRLARYVRPDELHTAFNFDFLKAPWDAERMREVIDECIESMTEVGAPTTWVLSNHDVVRHRTRYGGGNAGLARARAAALLMLALPGGAYVYQGEELGLYEVLDLPDDILQDPVWERSGHQIRGRDGCRVPIPWTREGESFGFGPGGSWLPQPNDWGSMSAQAQAGVPRSTLEMYRQALQLRHQEPSLGDGDLRWVDSPPGTLVFARDPGVVCAVNFTDRPIAVRSPGKVLIASGEFTDAALLPPNFAAWYRAGD